MSRERLEELLASQDFASDRAVDLVHAASSRLGMANIVKSGARQSNRIAEESKSVTIVTKVKGDGNVGR